MVFENRRVRKTFGFNREGVMGEWRRLLSGIKNITRIIKLSKMRWAGYVARMGEE
jgi:hypothetical protein